MSKIKGLKQRKNYRSSSAFRGNGLLEDNMETLNPKPYSFMLTGCSTLRLTPTTIVMVRFGVLRMLIPDS